VKKNPYVEEWEKRPAEIQPFPQQAMLSSRAGVMGGIGGQIEGLDADRSCFAMGQSAGGVHDVLPAAEIVARIMAEAEAAIDRAGLAGRVTLARADATRFEARDLLRDRRVALSDGSTGTAHGVAQDGGLLVHTAAGMRVVHSAEVSVRPAA